MAARPVPEKIISGGQSGVDRAALDTPAGAPLPRLAALWLRTGASVYCGIDATRTREVAGAAATFLLKATP